MTRRNSGFGFKHKVKREREMMRSRAELAKLYRAVRADSPEVARLLYRRVRNAAAVIAGRLVGEME